MPFLPAAAVHVLSRMRFWRCLLMAAVLSGMLPACAVSVFPAAPSSVFAAWKYTDLRLLQAPGSDPAHSLVALYSRKTNVDLEVRLDFFDLSTSPDFDVFLVLDTQPGGSFRLPINAQSSFEYDILVVIPASGAPRAYDAQLQPLAGLKPRSANHPALDLMTIQLNRFSLPGNSSEVGMQAFITPVGKPDPLHQTPPVFSSATPPAQAPLLLVFWDALPAATPAQMLRRWDGAHTGPYGGRHGLKVLLQAASSHNIPLVLADLKQPASLTALSAVGWLNWLRQSAQRGDVILPECAVGDPALSYLSLFSNQKSTRSNGFLSSPIAFGAFPQPLPDGISWFFADLPDRSRVIRWQSKRLIPLPVPLYSSGPVDTDPQVALDGLTLATRQALLAAALSSDPGDLVILGGSLPDSAWGENSVSSAAFEYIAAHPWIKSLDETGLNNFPATNSDPWPLGESCRDLFCSPSMQDAIPVNVAGLPYPPGNSSTYLRSQLRLKLTALEPGPFSHLALQSYLSLSQPTEDRALAGLQANALGYVAYLIEAARWDSAPYSSADCSLDLDFDGESECILASPSWFIIIKTSGGRLVFAAQRGSAGAAQWIGSPAQFGVGLGDPSEWKPEIGPAGNPAEIPGMNETGNMPVEAYLPDLQSGRITLRTVDSAAQKIFAIHNNELHIDLIFPQSRSVQIPITLASHNWAAGSPSSAWLPAPAVSSLRWTWQPADAPGLTILFEIVQDFSMKTSLDSMQWLASQENPNLAYPPGHYLSFPLAVIEARGARIKMTFLSP